jgi:hypothetical protein
VVRLLGVAVTAAPAAFAQANDQNCDDFASQAEAQAHLDADPSDPDGLDALPGPADGNDDPDAGGHGDGQACESFNYAPAPQPGDSTGTGGDDPLPRAARPALTTSGEGGPLLDRPLALVWSRSGPRIPLAARWSRGEAHQHR